MRERQDRPSETANVRQVPAIKERKAAVALQNWHDAQ
jgi:hypothetical protein